MATYFVDGAAGNDGNAGTSAGAGNAWATINKAATTMVAGDKTWVKASANYHETVTMSGVGSVSQNITYEGYTSTTGDGGIATIDGQNVRASGIFDATVGNDIYYLFKNFNIVNHTVNGVEISSRFVTWKDCRFNNNANGFWLNQKNGTDSAALQSFEQCQFNDNTAYGFKGGNNSDRALFVGCNFFRNGIDGVLTSTAMFIYCTLYDNADRQIIYVAGDLMCVINCTIDGKDSDNFGIDFGSNANIIATLVNTIIVNCASGFVAPSNIGERMSSRNNCFYNNTNNYVSGGITHSHEILTNPKFFDISSLDYRLGAGSPCIGAGYDGASLSGLTTGCDIGAYQSI
jgi:hypothetical protein